MTDPGLSIDPADDHPHERGDAPLWAESFLSYTYSPAADVRTWMHLAHLPGDFGLWEAVTIVILPDGRYLTTRSVSPARLDGAIETGSVLWRTDSPFERCSIGFRGGATVVSAADLLTGPLRDGTHVGVDLAYTTTAASAAYDYGSAIHGQSWGTGHIEQNELFTGRLRFEDKTIALAGTAWRDHSWGPRDFTRYGHHVFLNAHFPDSGRSLMIVELHGASPGKALRLAVESNARATVREVTLVRMPSTEDLKDERDTYEFEVETDMGHSVITVHVERPVPLAFLGTSQIGVGTHRSEDAHHDWVPYFSRFSWQGETGYGCVERSEDLRHLRPQRDRA